jgi:hypothetical protein
VDFTREWTAFGGASLALMGAVLSAGARRHAADNLAWRREWRRAAGVPEPLKEDGRGLILGLRLGGGAAAAAGLAVIAAAAAGIRLTAYRPAPREIRLLGALFAAIGIGVAILNLSRRSARGPRFLAFEPLSSAETRPLDERVASVAGWLLIVLWIWFGCRLLLEAPR